MRWWSASRVLEADEQGTPVRIRDGPAAVTGNESRTNVIDRRRAVEKARRLGGTHTILWVRARESEDLPTTKRCKDSRLWEKENRVHSRVQTWLGFFCLGAIFLAGYGYQRGAEQ